jgi:hypothetical protein
LAFLKKKTLLLKLAGKWLDKYIASCDCYFVIGVFVQSLCLKMLAWQFRKPHPCF